MKTLALDPKIISLANTLGIESENPVEGIREFCVDRVRQLVRSKRVPDDIGELQKIVCEKLNLTVHEIWSDRGLEEIISSYVNEGEPVFAFLKDDLNSGTYGVLIRLNKRKGSRFYWAAIVDCRGEKERRRFFTVWHEIVHCLTAADQYELPFHRTKISRDLIDPIERLTDIAAGDLAFFDPLFRPILSKQMDVEGRVTFTGVEKVREQYCAHASFESTLNACVSRSDSPTLLIKASLAFKNAERDVMSSRQGQLFPVAPPIPRLRVVSTIANGAARSAALQIHRHMRVPTSSIISTVFFDSALWRGSATENLHDWTSSDGGALFSVQVTVEARKIGDQVFAVVSPV
jgi:hypothetical protein